MDEGLPVEAYVVPVLFVGAWIFAIWWHFEKKRRAEREARHQLQLTQDYLVRKKLALDHCYEAQGGLRVSRRFDSVDLTTSIAVDDAAGHVYLVDAHQHGQISVSRFPFDGVLTAKLAEEGRTVRSTHTDAGDQFARAIVGELIGGNSGAFVGAMTARRVSTSARYSERIELRLTMDSLDRPLWTLVFSDGALLKDSPEYLWRKEQAKQWEASMKVLIARKSRRGSNGGGRAAVETEAPPARELAALPAEQSYFVSRGGVDLGQMPLSQIRRKIDRGDLSLDEDYYYDDERQRWCSLIDLI